MARKPWGELSPAYHRRMEANGLTARNWDTPAGAKLRTKARGHAKTPERPERAIKNPGRYREYLEQSSSLVDRVIAHKELLWGSVHKYRAKGAIGAVIRPRTRSGKSKPLNRANARKFLQMTQRDLDGLGEWWLDDDWCFLFYH